MLTHTHTFNMSAQHASSQSSPPSPSYLDEVASDIESFDLSDDATNEPPTLRWIGRVESDVSPHWSEGDSDAEPDWADLYEQQERNAEELERLEMAPHYDTPYESGDEEEVEEYEEPDDLGFDHFPELDPEGYASRQRRLGLVEMSFEEIKDLVHAQLYETDFNEKTKIHSFTVPMYANTPYRVEALRSVVKEIMTGFKKSIILNDTVKLAYTIELIHRGETTQIIIEVNYMKTAFNVAVYDVDEFTAGKLPLSVCGIIAQFVGTTNRFTKVIYSPNIYYYRPLPQDGSLYNVSFHVDRIESKQHVSVTSPPYLKELLKIFTIPQQRREHKKTFNRSLGFQRQRLRVGRNLTAERKQQIQNKRANRDFTYFSYIDHINATMSKCLEIHAHYERFGYYDAIEAKSAYDAYLSVKDIVKSMSNGYIRGVQNRGVPTAQLGHKLQLAIIILGELKTILNRNFNIFDSNLNYLHDRPTRHKGDFVVMEPSKINVEALKLEYLNRLRG